jgi:hypothetical protein
MSIGFMSQKSKLGNHRYRVNKITKLVLAFFQWLAFGITLGLFDSNSFVTFL